MSLECEHMLFLPRPLMLSFFFFVGRTALSFSNLGKLTPSTQVTVVKIRDRMCCVGFNLPSAQSLSNQCTSSYTSPPAVGPDITCLQYHVISCVVFWETCPPLFLVQFFCLHLRTNILRSAHHTSARERQQRKKYKASESSNTFVCSNTTDWTCIQ